MISVRDFGLCKELLTTEQMSATDRLAVKAGVCGMTLMEAAGKAVARTAIKMLGQHKQDCRIIILCGPGNNGGDGFAAARLLYDRGYKVEVFLAGEAEKLSGDAAHMAAAWAARGAIGPIEQSGQYIADGCLVIDALFGAGLSRPLSGSAADIVELLNTNTNTNTLVLAVDVPSGLDGNTGQPIGHLAVKAMKTVTFFRLKPGHVLYPGRQVCGQIVLEDIGIPGSVLRGPQNDAGSAVPLIAEDCVLSSDTPSLNLITAHDAVRHCSEHHMHKYDNGHVVVVSGRFYQTGAARLAARAALRAGSGLVTVASPKSAIAAHAAHLTAIMIAPFDGAPGLAAILRDDRINALVLGPAAGVGTATQEMVEIALKTVSNRRLRILLDADALMSFADDPVQLFKLIKMQSRTSIEEHKRAPRMVLTPHEGEFARLFPDINGDKLQRTRTAAEKSGAVVVLKGPDTVIAAPEGSAAIAANAPPWLATAGSGDVLAGMIAGEMARGRSVFSAACAGVWLHGECAREFGPGLIAEDLPEMLPVVLRRDAYAGWS